ncbi:MAG: cation:proton antiporter [Candidatus Woesearchaeota archaeon]
MDQMTTFAICLILALILSELCRKFNLPDVVGQITAGVILGLPALAGLWSKTVLIEHIEVLADLGIVFLLLLAGLEINIKRLEKLSRIELLVAFFSAAIPFIIGFWVMTALGYDLFVAIVVGSCLSITAEGTTLKVLMDMGQLNTKLGTIILGAGIIDDVIEVVLLALVLVFAQNPAAGISGSGGDVLFFPLMVLAFMAICIILFKITPKFMHKVQSHHSRINNFSMVMVLGIGIAAISQIFGLGPIIGAFFAGVLIHWVNQDKKEEVDIVEELKVMTFSFIIPFFFIYIGLHFDFKNLFDHTGMVILIVLIAIIGKLLGSFIVRYFTKKDISIKQSFIIGWGMNSRGAIELVIAEIARANHLIPNFIYSAIVIMAVVTTLIFPLVLKHYLKVDPHIMNE